MRGPFRRSPGHTQEHREASLRARSSSIAQPALSGRSGAIVNSTEAVRFLQPSQENQVCILARARVCTTDGRGTRLEATAHTLC